jgi:hypothetical protein
MHSRKSRGHCPTMPRQIGGHPPGRGRDTEGPLRASRHSPRKPSRVARRPGAARRGDRWPRDHDAPTGSPIGWPRTLTAVVGHVAANPRSGHWPRGHGQADRSATADPEAGHRPLDRRSGGRPPIPRPPIRRSATGRPGPLRQVDPRPVVSQPSDRLRSARAALDDPSPTLRNCRTHPPEILPNNQSGTIRTAIVGRLEPPLPTLVSATTRAAETRGRRAATTSTGPPSGGLPGTVRASPGRRPEPARHPAPASPPGRTSSAVRASADINTVGPPTRLSSGQHRTPSPILQRRGDRLVPLALVCRSSRMRLRVRNTAYRADRLEWVGAPRRPARRWL